MKVLLTSAGVTNAGIRSALEGLLGKPIGESSALFVPTAIYPFAGGAYGAWRAVGGEAAPVLAGLGWKSLGILELSALPSISEDAWVPTVRDADALLGWGGDPVFLAYWMRRCGLASLLPTLDSVYVGVSAGSIAVTGTFVETFTDPPRAEYGALRSEPAVFSTPSGAVERLLVTAEGVGLVDFAVIPHYENPNHPDALAANARLWASHIPVPTYAIDDDTALVVRDGAVQVVSEGRWELLRP